MSVKNQASGGIGFVGMLTIVFITLKLTHYIDWPWYWVLSPLCIPLAIFVCIIIMAFLAACVEIVWDKIKAKKN